MSAELWQERYLALLKQALTGTLFADEPDRDDPDFARFAERMHEHYFRSRAALSCLPLVRLNSLEANIKSALLEGVPGDLVEAGIWRGGAVIFMRAVLEVLGDKNRVVWGADSFRGLPAPDPVRQPLEALAHASPTMRDELHFLAVPRAEVEANIRRFGLYDSQLRLLEGWFSETLKEAPITKIAVLRVDADYYQSTRDVLENLYQRVSLGGYVIIDDYGEDGWTNCRRAVDELRAELAIEEELVTVDRQCVFWRRRR